MEEGDTEDELAPNIRFLNIVKEALGELSEGTLHVILDASGWLSSHLDRVLKGTHREVVHGHRGQEETEVGVNAFGFFEVEHDLLQAAHPGLHQVTVLEQHPLAVALSILDGLRGVGVLSLTEGDGSHVVELVELFSKLVELVSWISTSAQNKHHGSLLISVSINNLHGHWGRFCVELAHVPQDEYLEGSG
jgi:hypothetical protein